MFIALKSMLGMPVLTESGTSLGRVQDIEIDIETHSVRYYRVGGMFKKFLFTITPSQIKSITKEKIIVEDAVNKLDGEKSKNNLPQPLLDGVVSISKDL